MPELPEVETVVRSIRPFLLGQTILDAVVTSSRITRQDHAAVAERLRSAKIENVGRRGKQILIDVTGGVLFIHLGMTGKLLWITPGTPEPEKHVHARLYFDNGVLVFQDSRTFGRFEQFPSAPVMLTAVGPDALTISFEQFKAQLRSHRGTIKSVLLNQRCLSGVGNIYADESLFAASIHPKTRISRLSDKRLERLHSALLQILQAAVHARGSSISDYVDGAGERGSYQAQHNVYGKGKEPCPRCATPIRKIVLAQRGTHYCPRCQRS